ncbi:MAG: ATP-binding protein [Clostridia bacterium]|nr:ATP-binding protein [Clostridia bacterium]
MTRHALYTLACELSSLSVFRALLEEAPMAALLDFLCCEDAQKRMAHFGRFVYSLAGDGYDFSAFLCRTVYADENAYIVGTAKGRELSPALIANAKVELALFCRLTSLDAESLLGDTDYEGYIPRFENHPVDFERGYEERLSQLGCYGYGIFTQANMFRLEDGEIRPVASADKICVDSFVGYEKERAKVFDNTRALIEGRPAANVLLFGDAGTGKSSTVKACANHFAPRGVRLIELRKDQLFSLSHIMARIADNPLKFIIFIDDLSFNKNDDTFSMLKAALEGSASAKANNAVIYATSNRRHIVKESFSDREGNDDIHHSDTVQELMSLSDRFGLTVYFERPNKLLYLDIVRRLAERKGVRMDMGELDIKAEAFALAKGSRSPRAAEQFVNSLI